MPSCRFRFPFSPFSPSRMINTPLPKQNEELITRIVVNEIQYAVLSSRAKARTKSQPSARLGYWFLARAAFFVIFLLSIVHVVVRDTQIDDAHFIRKGLAATLDRTYNVSNAPRLKDYLENVISPLVTDPYEFTTTGNLPTETGQPFPWGATSEVPTTDAPAPKNKPLDSFLLGRNILIGAIRLVQHRSSSVWTCRDVLLGSNSACAPDFDQEQLRLQPKMKFIGLKTLTEFPFVEEPDICPKSFKCNNGRWSKLRPDTIYYPYSGFALDLYRDRFYANGVDKGMSSGNPVLDDFFDKHTRHVRITIVAFNPQYRLFCQADVHFEFPVTSGAFTWSEYSFVTIVDRSREFLYLAAEIVVWTYCTIDIIMFLVFFLHGLYKGTHCVRCQLKSDDHPVSSCSACGRRTNIGLEPMTCGWCGSTQQGIVHSCWRQHLSNAWTILSVFNSSLFVVARVIQMIALNEAVEQSRHVAIAEANHLGIDVDVSIMTPTTTTRTLNSTVPTLLFAPVADIFNVASQFLAVNLILAFVMTYRYIGRILWVNRILRVFSRGGLLIISFFLAYATVFTGFALAFHLLLASELDIFFTVGKSFASTFYTLLMVIDWAEFGSSRSHWVFVLIYVVFVFACALVMMNVLISIVTFEYRVSQQAIVEDEEFLSLSLVFEPLLYYFRRTVRRTAEDSENENPTEDDKVPVGAKQHIGSGGIPLLTSTERKVLEDGEPRGIENDEDDFDGLSRLIDQAADSVDIMTSTSLSSLQSTNLLVEKCIRDIETLKKFVGTCAGTGESSSSDELESSDYDAI